MAAAQKPAQSAQLETERRRGVGPRSRGVPVGAVKHRAAQKPAQRPTDPSALKRAFLEAFRARTRAARKARGMSQADIARALGISRAAYWTYETRTPLAHHLIEEFVAITGVDFDELFGVAPTSSRRARRGT
jgi:DNA-binding XRE family transcriptional regulator